MAYKTDFAAAKQICQERLGELENLLITGTGVQPTQVDLQRGIVAANESYCAVRREFSKLLRHFKDDSEVDQSARLTAEINRLDTAYEAVVNAAKGVLQELVKQTAGAEESEEVTPFDSVSQLSRKVSSTTSSARARDAALRCETALLKLQAREEEKRLEEEELRLAQQKRDHDLQLELRLAVLEEEACEESSRVSLTRRTTADELVHPLAASQTMQRPTTETATGAVIGPGPSKCNGWEGATHGAAAVSNAPVVSQTVDNHCVIPPTAPTYCAESAYHSGRQHNIFPVTKPTAKSSYRDSWPRTAFAAESVRRTSCRRQTCYQRLARYRSAVNGRLAAARSRDVTPAVDSWAALAADHRPWAGRLDRPEAGCRYQD